MYSSDTSMSMLKNPRNLSAWKRQRVVSEGRKEQQQKKRQFGLSSKINEQIANKTYSGCLTGAMAMLYERIHLRWEHE